MAENNKKKNRHSKAAASAVAAVTAAGVMVGGAFSSPQDILSDGPDAIVQTVNLSAQTEDDGGAGTDDGGMEDAEELDEKRGARASVRRLVRASPVGVRALVAVPLWGLGVVVMALASSLWSTVLSPAAATVLSWAGFALLAALIFTLAVKTAFPDLPLKKIVNKRSMLCIGVLCLLCGILDAALPLFWDDYLKLSQLVKLIGSFVCTGVPIAFFLRRRRREAPAETIEAEPVEMPEPEPTMEEKEAAARKLITELADSVSRAR